MRCSRDGMGSSAFWAGQSGTTRVRIRVAPKNSQNPYSFVGLCSWGISNLLLNVWPHVPAKSDPRPS